MIYQYFNINPIRIINQEILLLTGPKKREADKYTCRRIKFTETLYKSTKVGFYTINTTVFCIENCV